MGGIIVSEFVSIDGFYADPGGGLDWVTADDEHHDYSISLLERTGLLLFGRRTYEIFEAYWPRVADNPAATRRELAIGALLDPIPKIVYSRSRSYSGWVATVRPQLAPAELVTAKAETDGDIVVFGSGRLAQDLARARLVDEYHLLVQPVALGGGAPLFEPGRRTDLVLRRCEPLRSGVIRHFSVPATSPVERTNYSS